MGMVASWVMWHGPFEQTFVSQTHEGSIWNFTLIGQAVSEEKMFKECGWRTMEAYLSYKLTSEPSAMAVELTISVCFINVFKLS